MKKGSNNLLILLFFLIFFPAIQSTSHANIAFVSGKWETTFNCIVQTQHEGSLSCDGLSWGGDWTVNGYRTTIESAGNNPIGDGRGARFWKGSGGDNRNSGTIVAEFPTPQKELWVRWYERYEAGFRWGNSIDVKSLYFKANNSNPYVGYQYSNYRFYWGGSGGGPTFPVAVGNGWRYVYPTGTSDGTWHCFEVYMKMDTDGTDGEGKIWIDGVLVEEYSGFSWSSGSNHPGWDRFEFLSNQKDPGLSRPYYVDFDDLAVYNTTPSNRDANGNPFIGPIGWGGGNYTPPPSETPEESPEESTPPPSSPLPSDSYVILDETWEQNNVNNWMYDFVAGDTALDTSPVYAGNYAIKMRSSNPGHYVHFFGDHPQLNQPDEMVTDVTVEEYYYPPVDFQWPASDLKLWINNAFESWGAGYNLANGQSKPHTWAPYYMTISVDGSGRPFGQLTRADGLGGTGALWQNYWQNKGSAVSLVRGQWNKVKYRLKLNDPGQNNGIFQLWVNDVLKCDYGDINFRGNYSTYGWNHLMMSMHANPSHSQNQWISRDNIRIVSGTSGSGSILPPLRLRISD
ncbi:polysaccharide lyase [Desulfatitalea alkaliphila]|uniref:Polysaccharide lyase 14 domain-containing protein n=1 Tax=Desulfatitalea alkaliphila TaxID=2929485 RepID=A0AA41R8K6_9BACT|nr:hypothetical protein [Desulfatitalea alkaliphila]MCJ8503005.1 hypothetical protein [Desulfatitalea alkaliphila]